MTLPIRVYDGRNFERSRRHDFDVNSIKIGRAPVCDLVLDSRSVSRVHALLRSERGRMWIEVVGKNPTYVGERLVLPGEVASVLPQQLIDIAEFRLSVEVPGDAAEMDDTVSADLAALQLALHGRLLQQINLVEHHPSSGDDEVAIRVRDVLSDLVQEAVPSMEGSEQAPVAVLMHVLAESLRSEAVQEIFRRADNEDTAGRLNGFMDAMDVPVGVTVRKLLEAAHVPEGCVQDVRGALEKFGAVFDRVLALVQQRLNPGLQLLIVHRYLMREVLNLVFGFGPLQDLLHMPNITEIMVVDRSTIYVERAGRMDRMVRSFLTDDLLRAVIERIVEPLGRRIDRSNPYVDARLPDGSRVNAVVPPLAIRGPCLTIRKFAQIPFTMARLVENGTLPLDLHTFLEACIRARRNIIVAGGTGSGKTTLLNAISGFIPEDDRVVTIEDSAELQLQQQHVVKLETRSANVEGAGAITIRDLVRNALRMRPDRIIVGEVRGGEALDMLQAMNTGHEGSLTTLHANSPHDALLRLETMVLEAVDLPVRAIREQINAAVDLIVFQARERNADGSSGRRLVSSVAEVVGIDPEHGQLIVVELFELRDGVLEFSGYLPSFVDELIARGGLRAEALFHGASASGNAP